MMSKHFVSWVRQMCRPATRLPVALELEKLEDRLTPSVAPNDCSSAASIKDCSAVPLTAGP